MKLLDLFRRGSAGIARERLHVLLAHERFARGKTDLLSILREEILGVIARHVRFEPDKVHVKVERDRWISRLEVDIEIPSGLSATLTP